MAQSHKSQTLQAKLLKLRVFSIVVIKEYLLKRRRSFNHNYGEYLLRYHCDYCRIIVLSISISAFWFPFDISFSLSLILTVSHHRRRFESLLSRYRDISKILKKTS